MKQLRAIIIVLASIGVVLLAQHYLKRSEPGQRTRTAGETLVSVEAVGLKHFVDRIQAIGTVSANQSVTHPRVTSLNAVSHTSLRIDRSTD